MYPLLSLSLSHATIDIIRHTRTTPAPGLRNPHYTFSLGSDVCNCEAHTLYFG